MLLGSCKSYLTHAAHVACEWAGVQSLIQKPVKPTEGPFATSLFGSSP